MLIAIDASRIDARQLTGTERYSREVISRIVALGEAHQFRLLTRDPASTLDATRPYAHRIEWRALAARRLWTHRSLANELRQHPTDALFVPAHVLPFGFRNRALRRIRSVVTIHDCGFKHFPDAHPLAQRLYLEWSTRFAVRFATMIIADSLATKFDLEKHFQADPARIRVAYPALMPLQPVDDADAAQILKRHRLDSVRYALHIGTQQPRKNLRRLIAAWSASNPGAARLIIAGGTGWGGEDLRHEVARLGCEHSVTLLGYISDAERSVLLKHAHAYVFPSLYEGFGFGVLEAQACDVPVACSNTASLPEVAGDSALLFDPLSTGAMAQAINRVLSDEPLRARLREHGRRNLERFSWDDCAISILDTLTGARNTTGAA